ncbi:MAG: corrinoid protein-associated methyltransferase CpaM [Promethearchaeota archaeon]
MSYIYMKALEKKPEKYDNGIRILTLGKLPKIKKYITENYLKKNEKLLDIGMGTGTFAILCAQKGVNVLGIDSSKKMLKIAEKNIELNGLTEKIKTTNIPAIELENYFAENSFDKVTAILTFSEFYQAEQEFCLKQIHRILKDDGEFILVDEVIPTNFWKKVIYFIVKIPISTITYLFFQMSSQPLKNIEKFIKRNNFQIIEEKTYLLDSLKLIYTKKI